MMITDKGIGFIAEWEKYRKVAYQDVAGIWTIGYGTTKYHNNQPVGPGQVMSPADAYFYLERECIGLSLKLSAWIKPNLIEYQFDALVSLAYNIGNYGFKGSTLLRELNAGREIKENYFTRWKRAYVDGELVVIPGLLRRRVAEYALFATGDYTGNSSQELKA